MKINSANIEELQEYYSELLRIQDDNATSIAVLVPSTEKIYNIDLVSRQIEKPDIYTIVEGDHNSETIYFKFPRYYDNTDLTNLVCIIQYINADKESHIYVVPFYDVDSFSVVDPVEGIDQPMALIPWRIAGTAAAKAGTLTFSIRFYKLDDVGARLIYNLNTLPQTMEINKSLIVKPEDIDADDSEGRWRSMYEEFLANMAKSAAEGAITWKVLS